MKTVSKQMVLKAALVFSSSLAFAGEKDLQILNVFLEAGAANEQFMSHLHVGLDNISCQMTNETGAVTCSMTDISANEGNGATLDVEDGGAIFDVLAEAGAESDSGMGHTWISADSVRCTQAVEGVSDASVAERTACSIEVGKQQN